MQDISIHAPHTGRDVSYVSEKIYTYFISIHAPHTGRDDCMSSDVDLQDISIHAPHTGRDVTLSVFSL